MWNLLVVAVPALTAVPSISSLGIEWDNMPLRAMPVVTNFYGAATLRRDVEPGYGLISLGPITSAPFNGNFQNSTFLVNGQTARVKRVRWESCESSRSASFTLQNQAQSQAPCTLDVLNRVRMPFEDHGFLQVWELNSATCVRNVEMRLDGPLFRRCDLAGGCGWGTSQPIDRKNFARSIQVMADNLNVMVVEDKQTAAVSASIVWIDNDDGSSAVGGTSVKLDDPRLGFTFSFSPSASVAKLVAKQVVVVRTDAKSAIDAALTSYKQFVQTWSDACVKYEERWSGAFQPLNKRDAPRHFSGNLPALQSNSPDLDRLYYWSALALVSLERTNLQTFPRNFVISEGASVSLDGKDNMGGAGQFVWDLSFSAATLSLLEPEATKHLILYLIRYSDIANSPMQLPQFWDAYTERMPAIGGYCFDYLATFYLIHQYISITNDTSAAFLQTPIQNVLDSKQSITPLEYLRRLAWSWRSYPHYSQSPFLVDYGANKRSFLEAVPTYRDIVPALQFGNAGMLLAMSDVFAVLDQTKYAREIQDMRGNATGIVQDSLRYLYNPGTGYWSCVTDGELEGQNVNGTQGKTRTKQKKMEVRAIADMGYLGIALGMMGRRTSSMLPEGIRKEVAQFFNNELLADGWVRALSLKDPVMVNVQSMTPSVQDLVAMRSDWTGTGSYGGLAGICIDSLAEMELGFDSALAALTNISYAARNSMPAQGMAVMTPPYMQKFLDNNDGLAAPAGPYAPNWPEFFDVSGFPPWWPSTSRSLQNAEASVADAFIHSLFGWRPNWVSQPVSSSLSPSDAINAALWLPSTSRSGKGKAAGFVGVLSGVRTPYGYIDITANSQGLSWKWSQA